MVAGLYAVGADTIIRGEQVTQEELQLGISLDRKAEKAMEKWGLVHGWNAGEAHG
jgi:hypothetical protein